MATYRTCLIALQSRFIIIWQIFLAPLWTMLNIMYLVNQINFMIPPIQRLVWFFMVLFLYAAIFLSELTSLPTQLSSVLAEATLIIMIWATEWQLAQRCSVSQVRNEHVHNIAEETEIFQDEKTHIHIPLHFLSFNTAVALNLTKAENIIRMKAVLIKIVYWVTGQICYYKLKRKEQDAVLFVRWR